MTVCTPSEPRLTSMALRHSAFGTTTTIATRVSLSGTSARTLADAGTSPVGGSCALSRNHDGLKEKSIAGPLGDVLQMTASRADRAVQRYLPTTVG